MYQETEAVNTGRKKMKRAHLLLPFLCQEQDIYGSMSSIVNTISGMSQDEQVEAINNLRLMLHEISPFKTEPVDCVLWVKHDAVQANDYNPNTVAPPEMELLRHSINQDGYTQPVVTWPIDGGREVVDGFHRTRVCKECDDIRERVHGYLPVVTIRDEQQSKSDRIASTIRHNRARGKHRVDAMSDIVLELKNRNWANSRIAKELGMDEDEILRLCQITGLADLFSDEDFSRAWDIEGAHADDFEFADVDDSAIDSDLPTARTVNTSDPARIFHTFERWECHKAGFYASTKDGMTKKECCEEYARFLADIPRFESALSRVITEWKHSCEHYLTNNSMNRIAWLGQASLCIATGIPSAFCSGFNLLSEAQQDAANLAALKYLNIWLKEHGRQEVTIKDAMTERTSTLY